MTYTGSGGRRTRTSDLLQLLQSLPVTDAPRSGVAGRSGLIGSGYRAHMAQAILTQADAPAAPSDTAPLFEGLPLSSQPMRLAQNTSSPTKPLDPRTTDVFRPGPDGKLQAVPGWPTTGPFDVGKWARNIDWGGVGRDLSIAAAGIPGAAALKGPMTALEKAALLGAFIQAGWETKHKQDEALKHREQKRAAQPRD